MPLKASKAETENGWVQKDSNPILCSHNRLLDSNEINEKE
jgi:hypothetical protein